MPSANQPKLTSSRLNITDDAMLHALEHILPTINTLGYQAFLVGGCVRDTLLQHPVNDVDIVTNCPPSILQQHFTIGADISKNMDISVHLLKSGGHYYEVAQLRVKHNFTPLLQQEARPNHLETLPQTLKDDLERRDFTINALALAPNIDSVSTSPHTSAHASAFSHQATLLDPFGGQEDMTHAVIRAVVDANKRFAEDPLRILRAVRFAEQYGFIIEKGTAEAMQAQGDSLRCVVPERIQLELEKISRCGGPALSQAIDFMFERGILSVILPEIAELNNFQHAPEHHPEGNVLFHTLACLKACDATSPEVLFAILCHDLGKTKTSTIKKGKPSYPAHAKAALPIIEGMAQRLRWSNNLLAHVLFTAEHHMRFHAIPVMAPHKTFALMESPYFATLYTTALCDAKAREEVFDSVAWNSIEDRLHSLRSMFMGKNSPLHLLEGKRVMGLTGLKSGPLLGAVIAKTKTWMLDNTILDEQSIDQRLKQLAKSM